MDFVESRIPRYLVWNCVPKNVYCLSCECNRMRAQGLGVINSPKGGQLRNKKEGPVTRSSPSSQQRLLHPFSLKSIVADA
jgi:hypothetical protein